MTSQKVDGRNLQISVKLIIVVVVHLTLLALPSAILLYHGLIRKPLERDSLSGIILTFLLSHSTNVSSLQYIRYRISSKGLCSIWM